MSRDDGNLPRITFKAEDENALDVVRRAFLNRVKTEPSFNQLSSSLDPFFKYLDVPSRGDYTTLSRLLVDVYWEFVNQGIIAPGTAN